MNAPFLNSRQCARLAREGSAAAVDILVAALAAKDSVQVRVADYALGLVDSEEGMARLRHHLFHAPLAEQRPHAALYFKRRGLTGILEDALVRGCIDEIQARSR